MMECVDDLSQDTNKYMNFQRQTAKQEMNKKQYLLKRVSSLNIYIRCIKGSESDKVNVRISLKRDQISSFHK